MKILCLDRPQPGASFEKYQPHLLNEVRHTWQSYKQGIVRDIYFRQDQPGVAIFLECASTEEALKALADLPLVKAALSSSRPSRSARSSTGSCSSSPQTGEARRDRARRALLAAGGGQRLGISALPSSRPARRARVRAHTARKLSSLAVSGCKRRFRSTPS